VDTPILRAARLTRSTNDQQVWDGFCHITIQCHWRVKSHGSETVPHGFAPSSIKQVPFTTPVDKYPDNGIERQ
jgi:hypothetical protein